jgi:hypothetical protein
MQRCREELAFQNILVWSGETRKLEWSKLQRLHRMVVAEVHEALKLERGERLDTDATLWAIACDRCGVECGHPKEYRCFTFHPTFRGSYFECAACRVLVVERQTQASVGPFEYLNGKLRPTQDVGPYRQIYRGVPRIQAVFRVPDPNERMHMWTHVLKSEKIAMRCGSVVIHARVYAHDKFSNWPRQIRKEIERRMIDRAKKEKVEEALIPLGVGKAAR